MVLDNTTIMVSSAVVIGIIVLLLLIIIGIVTFNAYMFVVADQGIKMGAGGDFSIFGKKKQNKRFRNRMNRSIDTGSYDNQNMQQMY